MDEKNLLELAREVSTHAQAPHSHFHVGAAVLLSNGKVFTGCNIESPSLTFNICAERNAISTAIAAEGKIEIQKVVIYTPTDKPSAPCGLCRQLIFEYGKKAEVISYSNLDNPLRKNILDILPNAFDFNEY